MESEPFLNINTKPRHFYFIFKKLKAILYLSLSMFWNFPCGKLTMASILIHQLSFHFEARSISFWKVYIRGQPILPLIKMYKQTFFFSPNKHVSHTLNICLEDYSPSTIILDNEEINSFATSLSASVDFFSEFNIM